MLNYAAIRNTVWAMGAALLLATSAAFAHTEIKSQMIEGTDDDNMITIEHSCESSEKPIVAQSVVFPGDDAIATSSSGGSVDPATVIEQGSVSGLVNTIQDRGIFIAQQDKMDANGNQIGFSGTKGLLVLGKHGRVPFEFTTPNFVTTSCAKRLLIQLAVADICVPGLNSSDSVQGGKLNLWLPDNGSKYAARAKANDVEGIGFPPTLIVNRDLTAHPLPNICGAGMDVTLAPSPAAIDANLPIPGLWK